MSNLAYIDNDYARGYVASNTNRRKGVHVPLAFIDICNDNMHDAILFSQIMYWHEPSKDTGETRMRRERDGHLWIAKNHGDWYAECRIKSGTVRKCLDRLKDLKLIHYELHGEKGNKTPFIRVNWDVFAEFMQEWEAKQAPSNVVPIPATKSHTPATVEQGGVLQENSPLLQQDEPNTESTTENTNKETTPKPPSEIDELQVLIQDELSQFNPQTTRLIACALRGTLLKDSAVYNISEAISIDRFKDFLVWWDANHIKDGKPLTRPKNLDSLKNNIERWLVQSKQAALIKANTPVEPSHKPFKFDEQVSDEEHAKALEIIIAAQKERMAS